MLMMPLLLADPTCAAGVDVARAPLMVMASKGPPDVCSSPTRCGRRSREDDARQSVKGIGPVREHHGHDEPRPK